MIIIRWLFLFIYYSIILNNTDISILNKGKTFILTSSIEVYIKEQLAIEIQRFIIANIQLVTDKIKTERTKVNLEIDRMRLLEKKNSLIVKREKLRIEIVVINVVGFSSVLIRRQ